MIYSTDLRFFPNFNMDIKVPDSWLRDFLVTTARPEEIAKYFSLSGLRSIT